MKRHYNQYICSSSSSSSTLVYCRQQLHSTASGTLWSRVPGLLPIRAASPSMDHEHGTVCQPILEHQIRLCAPSSVISRPTCLSSSLRCCWHVGSAPFVRRRCDCLASSAPFTNIQTYILTYLPYSLQKQRVVEVIN